MSQDRQKAQGNATEPELDQRIQEMIGKSLKAHFDDILATPMPDRFLVLLSELESKEEQLAGKDVSHVRS